MMFTAASFLSILAVVAAGDVPSLTPDNYMELTEGKTVFVKFYAPWCGHCKKLAPDWIKLSDEWGDSEVGLVAEVDCTSEGKPLCDANGVRGFPTLKYGDPSNLEDYKGGRDFGSLSKFAKENLKPICSPSNLDVCDDEMKAQIESFMALPKAELDSKIAEFEKQLEDAEEHFKAEVQKLQTTYQQLSEEKDAKLATVKDSGLGLLKSVKIAKSKAGNDEL